MQNIVRLSVFFIIVVLAGSCQSARELHYFKSGGNYYRLRIKEHSIASKARYLSGYFDEKAVDKYFGDMSQPKDTVEWVTNKNSQLVMILSTNSTAIAEQIGNLASNEELLENIALMANKDKITQSKTATNSIGDLKKLAAGIINAGNSYIDTANSNTITQNLKDFINTIKINSEGHFNLNKIDSAISKIK